MNNQGLSNQMNISDDEDDLIYGSVVFNNIEEKKHQVIIGPKDMTEDAMIYKNKKGSYF